MNSRERRNQAEEVFSAYLRSIEEGEERGLDTLVAEHPELASDIEELHESWLSISSMLSSFRTREPRTVAGPAARGPSDADTPEGSPSLSDTPTGRLVLELRRRKAGHGRYRPIEQVARGGMGVVHRAWDDELDREVAMKVAARPGDASQNDLQLGRFLEEAQVTGQLVHPGIVPVHELGLGEDGQPFFTMQLVKGRELREILDLHRQGAEGWTRTRVLGVLLKVCEAMAYAHSKGVIHRDLKPGNVMVGRFGEVYVMDWGLARVLGRKDLNRERVALDASVELRSVRQRELQETPHSPLLTLEGQVLGTPSYMPPEQAEGDPEELDRRADVYAVGSILYELLTGRMPYVPEDRRISPAGIVVALLQGPPRPVAELAPDAPQELVSICEKAMSRERADRYADMSEMAADLSAFLEDRVVRAHATGAWAEARKWYQRNRVLARSLAAALVVVLASLGLSAYVQAEARAEAEAERRAALLSAEEARAAEQRAEAAREEAVAARIESDRMREDLEMVVSELGEPFPVATRLRALRTDAGGGSRELSLPGAPLLEGDEVTMEVVCVAEVSLFVFDQDDSGLVTQLFPIDGFELENPLPAGEPLLLPGRLRGGRDPIPWVVDDQGGPERLIALAVHAGTLFDPCEWLEDLMDCEPEGPTRGMGAQLDGEPLVPPTGPHPRSLFERLRRLSESRDDVWVRRLDLRK